MTIPHPNFEDMLAQVRQHPGLARRLALSVSCAVSCPMDDKAKRTQALKTITHGMAWVKFTWQPVQRKGQSSPFHEPPLPTACQLVPGKTKDDSCFRAEPRLGKTFLSIDDKVADPKEVWRRYHVLPNRYYTVTQEDYSLAAARADLDIDAPASARGPGPADSDASDHLVNSVNIYSTPWNEQGGRITTAEALHRHLSHANEHGQRAAAYAAKWNAAANQDPHEDTKLYAESLMQGVTVFVRHLSDSTSDAASVWRSLCRRYIELEIPDSDKDKPAYRIEFEEEGFLATSAVVAPRPQTGLISAMVTEEPGQPPTSFAVDVLRVQNTVGPKPQQFQPATNDPTRIGSLISPHPDWSDVRKYDVVMLTPEGGEPPPTNDQGQPIDPRDKPLAAHELVVHPVFRALGDPIRELDLAAFQGLRVLRAANRLPEKGKPLGLVQTEPPRNGSLYAVLIAAHATRFLDERGAAIEPKGLSLSAKQPQWRANLAESAQGKLKDFYHFLVEGERRYYALPSFQCGTSTATPFVATMPSGSPPLPNAADSSPRTEGVLCPFGPANSLSTLHLNPLTDVWGALTVPRPVPGKTSDLSFSASTTDPHDGEVTGNSLTCGDLMVLGQLDASSPLTLVRGRVIGMRFALQVKLKQSSATTVDATTSMTLGDEKRWDIEDGALPPIRKPDLKSSYIYDPIQKIAAIPSVGVRGVILQVQGTFEFATPVGDHLKLTADSYAFVKQAGSVNDLETAPPALAWVLVIETLDGRTLNATFPDRGDGIPDSDKVTRFLHPIWCLTVTWRQSGCLVQALDCRSWPQNVLGTYQEVVNRIAFTDGTQITKAALKATLADRTTGFFAVSWDAKTSISTIEAVTRQEGILIAGEVIQSMRAGKAIPDLGIEARDPIVELIDRYGQTWTIHQPPAAEAAIQPASPGLPPRPLDDIESGEFVVARCEVDLVKITGVPQTVAPPRPRWVRLRRFSTPEKRGEATICVVGTLDASRVAPVTLVAEGSDVYRPSTVTTPQNRQLEVWSRTLTTDEVKALDQQVVVAAAARVILAQTLTHFLHPTPTLPANAVVNPAQPGSAAAHARFADAGSDGDTDHPVHANVSELLARWSGWSLTVPMPGKTDDPGTSRAPKLPFRIVARRPRKLATFPEDASTPYPSNKDSWLLEPLRFHRSYQFCVRRSDLAGNHYYDESESHTEVLPVDAKKLESGLAVLTSLVGSTALAKAQAAMKADSSVARRPKLALRVPSANTSHVTPDRAGTAVLPAGANRPMLQDEGMAPNAPAAAGEFARVDRCGPPLLAFTYDQAWPSYLQNDGTSPAASKGVAPPAAELRLVAHQRALELVLVTDVFGNGAFTDDSEAELLPPPSAVETVFMHGRLDASPDQDVGSSIQWHERHLDYRLFGLNKNGWLNYFGDWTARTIKIGLRSGDTLPRTIAAPPAVAFFYYLNVLKPLRVQLALVSSDRPDRSTPGLSPPLNNEAIVLENMSETSSLGTRVSLKLPPGTVAEAVLQLPGSKVYDDKEPWRSIRLVHALNGPWLRPGWVKLLEAADSRARPNTITSRHVQAEFSLDVTSSGAFTVTGYWNDFWDEAAPAQHEPAVAVAPVENGSVRVDVIEPLNPGFGFGSQAVVLIQPFSRPRSRLPIFEPVLERGRVARIVVHDGGEGLPPDLKLRVIRRPPLLWPARATAKLRGTGTDRTIDAVTVDDPGGWYGSPPFVVAHDFGGDGYGARLRAVLDQYGGVATVMVDDGGRNYSNDVRIAFYTNRYETAELAIEYSPPLERLPTSQAFEFDHPFNDARARSVDYVVRLSSRFRHYLKDTTQQGPPAPAVIDVPRDLLQPASSRKVLDHVPRFSQPRQIDVTSRSRPMKPDLAYMIPAFEWSVDGLGARDVDAAARYFRGRIGGRLVVRRNALTRVYLFRPWNGSGPEQLGVVVLPATLNTIRVDNGDLTNPARVSPDDGGAFNVATSPEAKSGKELGYFNEPLAGSIIPEAMRPLVSRWGFDPAWREAAYPPLSVDQIVSRKPGTTYEWLAESPTVAGSATGTPSANPDKPASSTSTPPANPGNPRAGAVAATSPAAKSAVGGGGTGAAASVAAAEGGGNEVDVRIVSGGDIAGVTAPGKKLIVVGTDNKGLLRIRIVDVRGSIIIDTDETKFPAHRAAIAILKQQLPALSSHTLTDDEKKQIISTVTSIVSQTSGNDWRPVWLALHDVQYDAVKERWYVDLRIDLTEVARRHQSNPFVQLALVAYQVNGLPGQRVSPVALCDMYKLRGDRMLEAVRRDRARFVLTLRGEFEHTVDPREFPRRQVVARLQSRDPSLPREIVDHISHAVPPRRRGAAQGRTVSAAQTFAEYELTRSLKGDAYTAIIELEPSDLDAAELVGLAVIAVEEYEIYPAAEAGRGEQEDGLFVVDSRLCARQLVYAFHLEIGPADVDAGASKAAGS